MDSSPNEAVIDKSPAKNTIDFHQAIDAIVSGQRITATDWPAGWYACFRDEKLMLHNPNSKFDYDPWHITIADVTKEDYIIYRPS